MSDIVEELRKEWCPLVLRIEAADLIERQAAEGEALSKKAQRYFAELQEAQAEIERQAAEIDLLREKLAFARHTVELVKSRNPPDK